MESGQVEDAAGWESDRRREFQRHGPSTYCAMANAGYDFTWMEMQHDQRDWQAVASTRL
jgi:hypothetical protein